MIVAYVSKNVFVFMSNPLTGASHLFSTCDVVRRKQV